MASNNLTITDIIGTLLLLFGYTLFINGFNELIEKNFITFSSVDMMVIGAGVLLLVFFIFRRMPNAFVSKRN